MQVDTLEEWVRLYEGAGLSNTQVVSGSFDMITPAGFLSDQRDRKLPGDDGRAL